MKPETADRIDRVRLAATEIAGLGLAAATIAVNRRPDEFSAWGAALAYATVSTVTSPIREVIALKSAAHSERWQAASRIAYGAALTGAAAAATFGSKSVSDLKPFANSLIFAAVGQLAPVGFDIEHPSLLVRASNWRTKDPIFPGQTNRFSVEQARGVRACQPSEPPKPAATARRPQPRQTRLERYGFTVESTSVGKTAEEISPTQSDLESGLAVAR